MSDEPAYETGESEFAVVETTAAHEGNGKRLAHPIAAERRRRTMSFEIPPDKRPTTVAELSRIRTEQASEILFALGIQNIPRDGIGDISEALEKYTLGDEVGALVGIRRDTWCSVLNGYLSLSEAMVELLVARLGYPRWAEDIVWGLFCVSVRLAEPVATTPTGDALVPVVIFVDQTTNTLQVQVPDGYSIENDAVARVDNERLYFELQLRRER